MEMVREGKVKERISKKFRDEFMIACERLSLHIAHVLDGQYEYDWHLLTVLGWEMGGCMRNVGDWRFEPG